MAKTALVNALPGLSKPQACHDVFIFNAAITNAVAINVIMPCQARRVISDVVVDKKSGVATLKSMLRLLTELQLPEPMELYLKAWRNGHCHRDIAIQLLIWAITM